jgi:hypothetical protein
MTTGMGRVTCELSISADGYPAGTQLRPGPLTRPGPVLAV